MKVKGMSMPAEFSSEMLITQRFESIFLHRFPKHANTCYGLWSPITELKQAARVWQARWLGSFLYFRILYGAAGPIFRAKLAHLLVFSS